MADDEFSITAVVAAAARGDQSAWNDIVDRYSPLLVGVLRQCRLTAAETEDVAQTVWLRLVEHLDTLGDAHALSRWIVTTGRHEAWRQASTGRRVQVWDPASGEWPSDADLPREALLRGERQHALLAGMAELGSRDRHLLLLLMEDPPPSSSEISRRTGIPVGGIGVSRARASAELRRTQAIRAIETDRPESTTRATG